MSQDPSTPDPILSVEPIRPLFRSHPLVKGLLVLACVCAIVCFFALVQTQEHEHVALAQVEKPSKEAVARIGLATNPAYREKVEDYAVQKSAEARVLGSSFVPPIAEGKEQVGKERVATQPPPKVQIREQKPTPPRARQTREPQQSLRSQRMEAALGTLFSFPLGPQAYLAGVRVRTPPPPVPAEATPSKPQLSPGDILYAINRTALTSDAPGPVLAEVVDGPFRHAKVLGHFQVQEEHITIRFTQLIPRDGQRIPITAYGIDPATDQTALASHVDRHLLERFGALFAASFLEGLGTAIRTSGTANYATAYGGGTTIPHYSVEDEVLIALGKVGERAASGLQQASSRKPTVTLKAGIPIGIFLVDLPGEPGQRKQRGAAHGTRE